MTESKPNRLQGFREQSRDGVEPDIQEVAGLPRLLTAFREATGWSLQYRCGPKPTHRTEHAWSAPVNPGVGTSPGHARLDLVRSASAASDSAPSGPGASASGGSPSALSQSTDAPRGVRKLASAVAEILGELLRTRRALWHREAELAAGVPIVVRPGEEKHLAARLQAVLRGGAQAVGCHAAALYLLDEGTSHLKLRSSWGLPPERLTDPPRPLQGAMADLEAMLGHAVVLEDTGLVPNWSVPEEFPCAACVPVATGATILGTLWVFCDARRDFNDRETNILEVVAGRLAADLEREMLLRESVQGSKFLKDLASAEPPSAANSRQSPRWSTAGTLPAGSAQTGAPHGDFFDWFSMPEGLIAVALGGMASDGLDAALTASTLRGALRSHSQYHRTADGILRQVNLTLWTSSAGDQAASLFFGLIDSREGLFRYAMTGNPSAIVLQPDGWKSLTEPRSPLGTGPESDCVESGCPMQVGETIVAFTLQPDRGHPADAALGLGGRNPRGRGPLGTAGPLGQGPARPGAGNAPVARW